MNPRLWSVSNLTVRGNRSQCDLRGASSLDLRVKQMVRDTYVIEPSAVRADQTGIHSAPNAQRRYARIIPIAKPK